MAETMCQSSSVVFTLGNVATRSHYNIQKLDHTYLVRMSHAVRISQDLFRKPWWIMQVLKTQGDSVISKT